MLALALAAVVAAAQAPQDTLIYNLAVMPAEPHLSVEARLTDLDGSPVVLVMPPAATRAGTIIQGISATDDRGVPLPVTRDAQTFMLEPRAPGAIRFRYRIDFRDSIPEGSTSSGMSTHSLYAVTASLFVAPDPVVLRKIGRPYPAVRIRVLAPADWRVISGYPTDGPVLEPAGGDELTGSTLAAAPDFRVYNDTAGGAPVTLAIRGHRYFSDSLLATVVKAALRKGEETLGPVPVARVTYTSDIGLKGRTSGSLQGDGSIGLVWEPGEVLERARAHDTFHETLHLWFGGAMETERWWIEGVTDYFAARLLAAWRNNPGDLAALCYESYYNYLAIQHNTRLTMDEEARRGLLGDNTQLLVYRKGMLAGLLLDAAIRRATHGQRRLDDVARRMLALAATRQTHYIREDELRSAVRDVGGADAALVWDHVVPSTELISAAEVTAALHDVTGMDFPLPPRLKPGKTFSGEMPPGVIR